MSRAASTFSCLIASRSSACSRAVELLGAAPDDDLVGDVLALEVLERGVVEERSDRAQLRVAVGVEPQDGVADLETLVGHVLLALLEVDVRGDQVGPGLDELALEPLLERAGVAEPVVDPGQPAAGAVEAALGPLEGASDAGCLAAGLAQAVSGLGDLTLDLAASLLEVVVVVGVGEGEGERGHRQDADHKGGDRLSSGAGEGAHSQAFLRSGK